MRRATLCLATIGLTLPVLALARDVAISGDSARRPPALRMPSGAPINFGTITLPSGHVFTLLHLGALQIAGDPKGFFGLLYLSETDELSGLQEAAQELFEAVRMMPERAGVDLIVVYAYLKLPADRPMKLDDIMPYEVRFTRAPSGTWTRHVPADQTPSNAKTCANCKPPTSDREGVAAARQAGATWLAQLAAGQFNEAEAAIAPQSQSQLSLDRLVDMAAKMREGLGRIIGRKELAVLELSQIPGSPRGEYVELSWRTSATHADDLLERLTMMRAEDGRWRVVGYSIR